MKLTPANWIELALDLNVALDEGRFVPLEDTCRAIASGNALEYLKNEAGNNAEYFDESPHTPEIIREISKTMARSFRGSGNDHAVEHNGLCLLLALCLETLKSEQIEKAQA